MYKAVISDLDGTLLCRGHHVTKFTKDVIKEIIEKGINFYIASGRSYDQIGYITEQLEVKIPIIAANGARIFDADGNMIYEKGLPKEAAEAILGLDYESIAEGSHLNIFSGNDWIITKGTAQKVYDRVSRDVKVDFKEIPKDKLKNLDILKIFYIGEHEQLTNLEKAILKIRNDVNVIFVADYCMEIMAKGANKGAAAKFLLEREGLELKDTVAFGDGENDFEMLTMVGKGYAMGNSIERLRKLLPKDFEFVGANTEDGEAVKLRELFLERAKNI